MEIVRDPEGLSIGTSVSYHSILSLTIQRLLSTLDPVPDSHYPLKVKISDGLGGSGCHQTYNQQSNSSLLSTKLSFCSDSKYCQLQTHLEMTYSITAHPTLRSALGQ